MGIIVKPNNFAASTPAVASQVNANFDVIYNAFNGNIDSNNLATNSVVTSKIADNNVTTAKINDAAVTTAKINNLAVTTDKIADSTVTFDKTSGIWWEELGRATATVTTTSVSVSSIPARKYLKIIAVAVPVGGTLNIGFRFNNDSAGNYAERGSSNGAADATATGLTQVNSKTAIDANRQLTTGIIDNVTAEEKLCIMETVVRGSAGANVPDRKLGVYKWVNTSAQINRIDMVDTGGTGDIAAGSELIVLGHN